MCKFKRELENGTIYHCPIHTECEELCFFHKRINGKKLDENIVEITLSSNIRFAYLKEAEINQNYDKKDVENIKELFQKYNFNFFSNILSDNVRMPDEKIYYILKHIHRFIPLYSGNDLRKELEELLHRTDLKQIRLKDANLYNAKMSGVDLSNADLSGAIMRGIDLSGARLRSTNMNNARINNSNLEGADLQFAKMNGAILSLSKLNGARLEFAKMDNSELSRAGISGAILTYAKLNNANLNGANLNNANLVFAHMNGSNLNSTRMNCTALMKTEICNSKFYNADMSGADLNGAYANNTDFSYAKLNGANLSNTRMNENTNLTYSELKSVSLDNSYITETKSIRSAIGLDYIAKRNSKNDKNRNEYIVDEVIKTNNEKDYIFIEKHQLEMDLIPPTDTEIYKERLNLANYIRTFQYNRKWVLSKKDLHIVEDKFNKKIEYTELTKDDLIMFRDQSLRIYSQLHDFYSKEGIEEKECNLNFLKNEARRKLYWIKNKRGTSFGYLCIKYSCDYGNSFLRVAITSALIMGIYTLMYFVMGANGGIYYDDPSAASSAWSLDLLFDALFLSVTAFTNLGFSLVQPDVRTVGIEIAVITESILGLVIIAMLVYTITRKISK